MTAEKTIISIETTVNAPVEKVWNLWNDPKHIIRWNTATPEWHAPFATNNLREGGKLNCRMEAKDGSMGFDFEGVYTTIEPLRRITYVLGDNRKVDITFTSQGSSTHIKEVFEAEDENSIDMQRMGWQAILDNFKKHAESYTALLEFEIDIKAPVEKVYNTMLDDATYRQWTAIFNDTSHYIGKWQKGEKLLFIGTNKDGKKEGMVSRVRELKPNEYVSIEHLGLVDGDKEITSGEQVAGWAGALENYTFVKNGDHTRVLVDMDSNEQFKSYFEETWPKALEKLKEISE